MSETNMQELGATSEAVSEYISEQLSELKESFSNAFNLALRKYAPLEQQNKKGALSYCYVSFLRSSVIERRSLYRIDLYDEKQLLDLNECFSEWNVDFLTGRIYKDIPMEIKPVPDSNDLTEYQIEQLWICEAEKYFTALAGEITGVTQTIRQGCGSDIKFYYGEFLGKSTVV